MRKILTFFFGLVLTSQAAHAENLSFCYDPYPPYTLGEEGPATGGMKVALLDAVMAQIDGVSATVTLLPWKRCQAVVRSGEMDGILLQKIEELTLYVIELQKQLEAQQQLIEVLEKK